jgi:class 3 adenylate cyclase/sensor domain CHASE-containing protein
MVSLRTKILAIILAATVGLAGLALPLRTAMLSRFAAIEREIGARDLDRARNELNGQVDALYAMARDYAAWDETWAFAAGEDPTYPERNWVDATFAQNRIGFIAIVGVDGSDAYTRAFDLHAGAAGVAPTHAELFPPGDEVLLAHRRPESDRVAGLARTSRGLMVVGAHPILTSTRTGPPRGTVLLGRTLDALEVASLGAALRLDLSIVDPAHPTPEVAQALPELRGEATMLVRPLDDDTLAAYARLDDVRSTPCAILRVAIPRTVYALARRDANIISLAAVGASLTFGLLLLALLQRFVVRRVSNLAAEVTAVGEAANHSLRVTRHGSDELATLADNINAMLSSLQSLTRALDVERAKAEKLLRNILPPSVAARLKADETIADSFPEVSVLFADIVGFTELSAKVTPDELVKLLNEIFSLFDDLAERHRLEKIKTIGDAYMIVAGVPDPRPDHAEALAVMALDMQDALARFNAAHDTKLAIRVGINSGPVVAGVIGTKKFIYDLWGDAVNIASRMESSGLPGRVQITEATRRRLDGKIAVEERGTITIKGKGEMRTWLLLPRSDA